MDKNSKELEKKQRQMGEFYNSNDVELIKQLVQSRLQQHQELEFENLDEYLVPPRTLFSMMNKPSVTLKYGKIRFNMACLRLFKDVEHVLPMLHQRANKLLVKICTEEELASVEWAKKRKTDGTWQNKDITSEKYAYMIFERMKWKPECRYKALGHVANSTDGLVLVFDLDEAIMFDGSYVEYKDEASGQMKKKRISYLPDIYKDTLGKSYKDYVAVRQISMFEILDEYNTQTYSNANTKENPVEAGSVFPDSGQEANGTLLEEGV